MGSYDPCANYELVYIALPSIIFFFNWFFFMSLLECSYELDDPSVTQWMDVNNDANEKFGLGLAADFFSWAKYLPTSGPRMIKEITKTMFDLLRSQVDEAREHYDPGERITGSRYKYHCIRQGWAGVWQGGGGGAWVCCSLEDLKCPIFEQLSTQIQITITSWSFFFGCLYVPFSWSRYLKNRLMDIPPEKYAPEKYPQRTQSVKINRPSKTSALFNKTCYQWQVIITAVILKILVQAFREKKGVNLPQIATESLSTVLYLEIYWNFGIWLAESTSVIEIQHLLLIRSCMEQSPS